MAFAPQVKFVKKCKGQAAAKTVDTAPASKTKNTFNDKTESASESDDESSDDSTASSDDEQETAKERKRDVTGVADFKANVSKYGSEDDEDDDLLVKKTGRSDKLLELQDIDKAVVKPVKSQVLLVMFIIISVYSNTHGGLYF